MPQPSAFTEDDHILLNAAAALLPKLRDCLDRQMFHEALEAVWVVVRAANGYVDRQAPWGLKKTDPARMGTVLYVLAETVRQIALLLQPVMPGTMARLLDQLAVPADRRDFTSFAARGQAGTPLPKPEGVFPRFVEPEEGGTS
jgi:methionyl-tRNA synthetase